MATLTTAELADIRLITGAADTSPTDAITDAIIQAQYDLATANAPSDDLILPYTYVAVLERLWTLYDGIMYVQRTTDHGDNERLVDPRSFIQGRLKYWQAKAGLTGGVLRTGALVLGIDTTQEWVDSQLESEDD